MDSTSMDAFYNQKRSKMKKILISIALITLTSTAMAKDYTRPQKLFAADIQEHNFREKYTNSCTHEQAEYYYGMVFLSFPEQYGLEKYCGWNTRKHKKENTYK